MAVAYIDKYWTQCDSMGLLLRGGFRFFNWVQDPGRACCSTTGILLYFEDWKTGPNADIGLEGRIWNRF